MSEDEQAGDFQAQLDRSCTRYITTLEEFNTRLCEGSDRMGDLILEFLAWCQNLKEIGARMADAFHSEVPDRELSGAGQYVGYCTDSAALLECQVGAIVDDKYTTDQVGESKNLFTWFSDVSKCYRQFKPQLSFAGQRPCHHVHRAQRALDRKFSEILLKLAENVGAKPADLAELNLIPTAFPHHSIAYMLLLCRLVDAQMRLEFVETSYRAHMDMIEVKRMFPAPPVLQGWAPFRAHIESQNELVRLIVEMKGVFGQEWERMGREQAELKEVLNAFEQFTETYKCLCKESADLMDGLVAANMHQRCLEFVRDHGDVKESFEIPGLETLLEEEKKDVLDVQKLSEVMKEMREKLAQEIDVLQTHLRSEHPRNNSVQETFKGMFTQVEHGHEVASRTVAVLKQAESVANFVRVYAETLCSRDFIRGQTVVAPAVMNLDGTIDFLKHKIESKQVDEGLINKEICERRFECDRIAAVGASLKYKAQNQESICKDCEERRMYCLTKCGHTFCEHCYNRIRESRVLKCPYPNCDHNKAQFSPEDVIRINWE